MSTTRAENPTIPEFFTIETFDPSVTTWKRWEQRLQGAFHIFGIKDTVRVLYLLHYMGPTAFNVLCDRLDPLEPYMQTYDTLKQKLEEFYDHAPLEIAENYKFYQRKQNEGESVQQFVAALHKLSTHCKFSNYLKTALRNQFVFGLVNKKAQSRLLERKNLDFEEAVKIAVAMELSEKNSEQIKADNSTMSIDYLKTDSNNVMTSNPQQQQQQLTQQQLRLTMQLQQQNAQQAAISVATQSTHNQPGSQLTECSMSQSVPIQVSQTVVASQTPVSVFSVQQQIPPSQAQSNIATGTVQGQQLVQRNRQNVWQGILEWHEKVKNPTDTQKQTRHVPCQVSANLKNGEPELKADTWPPKLIMQLMSKQLIGSIGNIFIKNSKSVMFHPTPCEALESLTKVLTAGFAGCVHFTSAAPNSTCEIKVLILLYTLEKKSYLGFIPNDQTGFVDRLRKVIQQQKTSHASLRQAQGNPGPGNTIPVSIPPTTGTQGGILMSQTNTTAMGGAQITQSVVSSSAPQMNMQNNSISGPQANVSAGGLITQQRPQFDDIEIARHQNLLKIQRLRQTLEAAQQQEAQYKSQLEVNIQQNLEVAQQQEMQYKQQLEAQQAQRGLNPAAMPNQQANTQRMMRPISTNSIGLRHLLQQSQPQYRPQVFGVQQQMVGPRGQIATRPMAPTNTQNQQFEDVPNYDFLNCQ